VDTARVNPDTGTQFHVLRHADSTATGTDSAHVTLDFGAHAGYAHDDRDAALVYRGAWSHAGPARHLTGGDYRDTEARSGTAGDTARVAFTGTGASWISSRDRDHGRADVYLDGVKARSVDLYAATRQNRHVAYRVSGLPAGRHTLTIVVDG